MAVSDWSADPRQNIALGGFKLNGEFGAMFAEMMAQIKALKQEVDAKLENGMTYKGSVASVAALPASGNEVGDVYNIGTSSDGPNYVWTGTAWDLLGDTLEARVQALEGKVGAWTEATPARTGTVCAAVEAIESGIGAWTDETETTTVKAAIEALRPEPEPEG